MLQTDPRLKKVDQKVGTAVYDGGCYFMVLLKPVEILSKKELTPEQVIEIYRIAIKTKSKLPPWKGISTLMGENCLIRDPDAITEVAARMLEHNQALRQVGIQHVDGSGQEEGWWGGSPREWQFTSLAGFTKNGRHFRLGDSAGVKIFDPDPRAIILKEQSRVLYRIRVLE